ncbi:hypothetical protein CLAFUW4_00716 [Fulvia fulva]|uniref:Uncharacterized protein n=1 Tax=Passalora fulva TaxID=5499 RepID=A0A9Q8P4G1_PASFU|nr:uncharacterized protein CLAFUR5_00719 [Fulvia fulva]KAK4634592.1 hypothetical protein CLAFUR4_00717 [Fulvia fulva]KAK4638450.1 hypothetical protein CLAFUR0_00718 [Fulvia fulva]UJO12781.1 hypothetical protein CLAFUR5_00719 [Fulvia fulva]WPV08939.1 hypothetical protein CLAFUW4_00716 [Fulvia fulva]WPV23790.1 hypothetical protein CLAFUW7_00721 [Fulvia fulva]
MSTQQPGQAATGSSSRLQSIIEAPKTSFSQAQPMHKQIWNTTAPKNDVQCALAHAHAMSVDVLQQYATALETRAAKARAVLAANGSSQLATVMCGSIEDMKGNICVLVQQRWTFEEMMQRLSEDEQEPRPS